jgi:hypothetical protein
VCGLQLEGYTTVKNRDEFKGNVTVTQSTVQQAVVTAYAAAIAGAASARPLHESLLHTVAGLCSFCNQCLRF